MIAERSSGAVTKSDAAYIAIRRMIMAGDLAAGEVVDQVRLAQTLGLSTTPIREALRRLEGEDLISATAHRYVQVASYSWRKLNQLYQVRLVLDPLAAELATVHATDHQIGEACAYLQLEGSTLAETLSINRLFHRGIYAACGNDVLIETLDSLWDKGDRWRALMILEERNHEGISQEHLDIAEAFRQRDAEGIGRLMKHHLTTSLEFLRSKVDGVRSSDLLEYHR